MTSLPRLDAHGLIALAREADTSRDCGMCSGLQSRGWDSLSPGQDAQALERIATLRDEREDEPTLQEHHPDGTHGWSAEAPVALGYHPYNRCDVWRCTACRHVFLRYTEYGGYYQDERIRLVDPGLVVV
jgi:hypothetical protein